MAAPEPSFDGDERKTHPAGALLDDKFRILSVLGAGGMGSVYEIEHTLTRHVRALKLLHPEHAARKTAVDRFLREASAAGRIGSPHIVETFDAGWLTSGEPYLVMEMLDGMPLSDRIDDMHGSGMPIDEARAIMVQVCRGVAAAHEAGIVHRDIKPDNVFLCGDENGWFAKLLDFGISKFDDTLHTLSTQVTADGALMGTPAYMSPEQFEDASRIDERTDVYALGLIFYEMLVGEHPYPSTTLAQLAKHLCAGEVAPVTETRPEVPPFMSDVIRDALRKIREERTITAEEMADRLEAGDLSMSAAKVVVPTLRPLSDEATADLGLEVTVNTDETADEPLGVVVTDRPPPARLATLQQEPQLEDTTATSPQVQSEPVPREPVPPESGSPESGSRAWAWLAAAGALIAVGYFATRTPATSPLSQDAQPASSETVSSEAASSEAASSKTAPTQTASATTTTTEPSAETTVSSAPPAASSPSPTTAPKTPPAQPKATAKPAIKAPPKGDLARELD